MSEETLEHLNASTLIGFTKKRGEAWHYREELQGDETNHYQGAIPIEDVKRRLFPWHVVEGELSATALTEQGVLVGTTETLKATMRDDTGEILGVSSKRRADHQYDDWLVDYVGNLLDADLAIASAGVLKGGRQAWVQIEMEDTLTVEGVEFRPFLTAATSHDASLATTYITGAQVVVCDNTLSAALRSSDSSVRIKHTAASLSRLQETRDALGIVFAVGQRFTEQVETLVADKVSEREWTRFVAAITQPKPGSSERSKTMARNKVEDIVRLWEYDERVAPWKGTAFGVVQAVNTWSHHIQTVKGGNRAERNMDRTITGEWDKLDATTLRILEAVR